MTTEMKPEKTHPLSEWEFADDEEIILGWGIGWSLFWGIGALISGMVAAPAYVWIPLCALASIPMIAGVVCFFACIAMVAVENPIIRKKTNSVTEKDSPDQVPNPNHPHYEDYANRLGL